MKQSQFLSLCVVIIAAPHCSWEIMRWVSAAALLASWVLAWREA